VAPPAEVAPPDPTWPPVPLTPPVPGCPPEPGVPPDDLSPPLPPPEGVDDEQAAIVSDRTAGRSLDRKARCVRCMEGLPVRSGAAAVDNGSGQLDAKQLLCASTLAHLQQADCVAGWSSAANRACELAQPSCKLSKTFAAVDDFERGQRAFEVSDLGRVV
jgi:hypothetical protein